MTATHLLTAFAVLSLTMSVLCMGCYAWDKWSAVKGRGRVSERRLHLLSVLGGWPGAVFAQRWFRHKTVKVRFRRYFYVTIVINLAATGAVIYLQWQSLDQSARQLLTGLAY